MLICMVILAVISADQLHAYEITFSHKESNTGGEQCTYKKYEGGDGSVYPINPVPTIEAAVPTTALANLFGKADPLWLSKLDLGANGLMHFGNALKGNFQMFANTAPKLGPVLGVLGVGFGFINRQWNSVKPHQIINEMNKVIAQVIEQTNRRFELFEELIGEKIRSLMKEAMDDIYRGHFETWKDCAEQGSPDRTNDCQLIAASAANRAKYRFMFQTKYEAEANGNDVQLGKDDIKALELQLPMLKKWADFHLLVLGTLVKTYEGNDDALYQKYRLDLIDDGRFYVAYMEWALERIQRARLDEQPRSPTLAWQGGYDKEWKFCSFCFGDLMTAKYLRWSSHKGSFKATTMKAEYCDITGKLTCKDERCLLGPGLPWFKEDDRNLGKYQRYVDRALRDKANKMVASYTEKLTIDFFTFWNKEIRMFIPKLNEIIEENEKTTSSGKRVNTPGQPERDLTEEEKKLQKSLEDASKEKDAVEKAVLNGITADLPLEDYLQKVKENSEALQQKSENKRRGR